MWHYCWPHSIHRRLAGSCTPRLTLIRCNLSFFFCLHQSLPCSPLSVAVFILAFGKNLPQTLAAAAPQVAISLGKVLISSTDQTCSTCRLKMSCVEHRRNSLPISTALPSFGCPRLSAPTRSLARICLLYHRSSMDKGALSVLCPTCKEFHTRFLFISLLILYTGKLFITLALQRNHSCAI